MAHRRHTSRALIRDAQARAITPREKSVLDQLIADVQHGIEGCQSYLHDWLHGDVGALDEYSAARSLEPGSEEGQG